MTNQIKKLTELQASLGYKFNGEINPVALLGLIGESAEVLHETILMKKGEGKFIYRDELAAASSVGAIIDNIKKKIRKNKDLEIEVFIDPDRMDAFDLELADTLYYLNILAANRGKTLGDYAELAFNKVSEKMLNPVRQKDKPEWLEKSSLLFSEYFKHNKYHLIEVLNKMMEIDNGVHKLTTPSLESWNVLDVLEVFIDKQKHLLSFLFPDIDHYMLVCREQYFVSKDENIFSFDLAIEFHHKHFGSSICYNPDIKSFFIK